MRSPLKRIEMPEKDADRQCGEHARPDQGCVALKIEIGARAHGERKRRQHDDCGERERIAAVAPLFKAERASRTHIEGESPERKENAKRRTERIKPGREQDCPQTDDASGNVACRDNACEPRPAVAGDVGVGGWSVCAHGRKNGRQRPPNKVASARRT